MLALNAPFHLMMWMNLCQHLRCNEDFSYSLYIIDIQVLLLVVTFCGDLGLTQMHLKGETKKVIGINNCLEESWAIYGQWIEDIKVFCSGKTN